MAPNSTLKTAIFERGTTQTVIARAAGLSESRLSRIIRGYGEATPEEKQAIAQALGRAVHELFSEAA